MNQHHQAVIHHVASQFFYRWHPLRHDGIVLPRIGVGALAAEDWRALIKEELAASPETFWARLVGRGGVECLALAVARHLTSVARQGGSIITIFDADYPAALSHISDPPLCLSVLGDTRLLTKNLVAIVGSRKASGYAARETQRAALRLAREGYVIVSGGALGCDAAAHYGACLAQVRPVPTIVVFAGGLSRFYPQANGWLFRELARGGSVFLSERLWWAPSLARDFPVRNRIISGMAKTVVIMQADLRSGAMITARKALDQGRDVAVLRHPEGDVRAAGNCELISDGALPFASDQELLELL